MMLYFIKYLVIKRIRKNLLKKTVELVISEITKEVSQRKTKDISRNMINKNMSIEDIPAVTGLSI